MLMEHFKLGIQPFGVTPDARFLYLSQTHREAISSLRYAIQSGRGFSALIAPPGMGKTTLLFRLLGHLKGNAKTAFLFQTLCGPEEFLRSLLADLGIEDYGGDLTCMHALLNAFLLQESKRGRQVVVVIDEAQNLDERVLEIVRILSNFETPSNKLLHLVLSGQPQLAENLASERLIQLRQRISIVARLAPFNADETREYIEHRLGVAGVASDKRLFSKQAYAMIAEHSGGIPRNINNLCFNSMSLACALKKPEVEAVMVQETINDLDLETIVPSKKDVIQQRPRGRTYNSISALFTSWRYRVAFAIGLLAFLGLFYSSGQILPERARSLTQQMTNNGDSKLFAAPGVFAQELDKTSVPQSEGKPGAPIADSTLPMHASIRHSHGPRSRHKSHAIPTQQSPRPTSAETRAGNLYTAGGAPDIGPLLKELQRLKQSRRAELVRNSQVDEKTQVVPAQNPVPFELIQQGEKR